MDAGRLVQELHAEREVRKASQARARELRQALRFLGSRLASLHACIMEVPDGGCGDIDVADCRKGCATCWAVWAELEAGRLRELRRREGQGAGERRRPMPEDLAGYAEMYGAE